MRSPFQALSEVTNPSDRVSAGACIQKTTGEAGAGQETNRTTAWAVFQHLGNLHVTPLVSNAAMVLKAYKQTPPHAQLDLGCSMV